MLPRGSGVGVIVGVGVGVMVGVAVTVGVSAAGDAGEAVRVSDGAGVKLAVGVAVGAGAGRPQAAKRLTSSPVRPNNNTNPKRFMGFIIIHSRPNRQEISACFSARSHFVPSGSMRRALCQT